MSYKQRHEALLNEYKGSLFEFLVAHKLAQKRNIESYFLTGLSEKFLKILEQQETFLRSYDTVLLKSLPILADSTAALISAGIVKNEIVKNITVAGKSLAADKSSDLAETDLIIDLEKGVKLISLKFSKGHAYVNTKSAGVKSIITKYFPVKTAEKLQAEFNDFCLKKYNTLRGELYQEMGLIYSDDFLFWESMGNPVLPGELNEDCKKHLTSYYEVVNKRLYNIFVGLLERDRKKFILGVESLMGYSNPDIYQVTCFYKKTVQEYECREVILSQGPKQHRNKVDIFLNKTNFEVKLNRTILQVRLKPMNKFTQFAFKINCSIKKLS